MSLFTNELLKSIKILLFLSLISNFILTNNVDGEIIPSERRVTWEGNVGVPGGVPLRTTCFRTRSSNTPSSVINSDLAETPAGQSVCIEAGIGKWTSMIKIPSNVTLRGAGPSKTIITSTINYPSYVSMSGGWSNPIKCIDLSADGIKGSSSITVDTNPSCLQVGEILVISEENDPALVNSEGVEGEGSRYMVGRDLSHLIKINSITGNGPYTVNFEPPLAYTFRVSRFARLDIFGAYRTYAAGLEDIKIIGGGHVNEVTSSSIDMTLTEECWVKNVEVQDGIGGSGVYLFGAYRSEVRDSYFNDSHFYGAGRGYGASIYDQSTGNLIENNIYRKYHSALSVDYGGAYNVFAYNYIVDGIADSGQAPGINSHGVHTYMTLWEGNYSEEKALFDFTHGSGSNQTLLRNRIIGKSNVLNSDQMVIAVDEWNRKLNFVGNILGLAGYHIYYSTCPDGCTLDSCDSSPGTSDLIVWNYGFYTHWSCGGIGDDAATRDFLIHGNYSYCTIGTGCNTTIWDPNIADHQIPYSYYLSSKPAFFGNLPWPPIGPDLIPMVGNIPSQLRYEGYDIPDKPTNLRISDF